MKKNSMKQNKKLTLSIDLDKTLCTLKTPEQTYLDVTPLPGAVEAMQSFKNAGMYLIINTARGMATFSGNVGLINKHRVPEIIEWLNKNKIPFDEIVVGKPHCDFFIDDKNIEFKNNWNEIESKILKEQQGLNENV